MSDEQARLVSKLENFEPRDSDPAELAELLYKIMRTQPPLSGDDAMAMEIGADTLLDIAIRLESGSLFSRGAWGAVREAMRYYREKYLAILQSQAGSADPDQL